MNKTILWLGLAALSAGAFGCADEADGPTQPAPVGEGDEVEVAAPGVEALGNCGAAGTLNCSPWPARDDPWPTPPAAVDAPWPTPPAAAPELMDPAPCSVCSTGECCAK